MKMFSEKSLLVLNELTAEIEAFRKETFTPRQVSIQRDETVMGKKTFLLQLINGYLAFLKTIYQKASRGLPALVTPDRYGAAPFFSKQTLAAEQSHWALEQGKLRTTRDAPELTRRADEILQRISADLQHLNEHLVKYKAAMYAELDV